MPTPAYAKIKILGKDVAGSVEIAGREDSMEIVEFNYGVRSPVDPLSARTTGPRVHDTVTFVKEFDKASPLLFKACVNSEIVDELVIVWYTIDALTGTEIPYFRHTLENCRIVGYEPYMKNAKDPRFANETHLEKISLLFQTITLLFEDGGLEHTDDWLAAH
jgi:type VI secretion system secreted protein Hcp